MKKGIQKLLVGINQRIQLGGNGKDNVKVVGINDFVAVFVNSEFLKDCLAVRAVVAGVGMEAGFRVHGYVWRGRRGRSVCQGLFREKPAHGSSVFKPVPCEDVKASTIAFCLMSGMVLINSKVFF